jgi:hypothetical protein
LPNAHDKGLTIGSLKPCVDDAYTLDLVEQERGLIRLQRARIPGVVDSRNEDRASEGVFI